MNRNLREPTFDTDIYGKPRMLSEKESIAQIITNALFLKPGNLPDNPTIGVDIMKYLYTESSLLDGDNVKRELIKACGSDLVSTYINDVSFIVSKDTTSGIPNSYMFLLRVKLSMSDGTDSSLGIAGYQSNNNIKYNWQFLDSNV